MNEHFAYRLLCQLGKSSTEDDSLISTLLFKKISN